MKKWVAGLLIVMLLLAAAGYYWFHQTRIVIDDEVYLRDIKEADFSGVKVEEAEKLAELTQLERLDLRDTGLTVEEYEYLRQALPDCQILWSVPFQEGYCSEEITELTVTSLTMQDLDRLAYLKNLHTVHAEQCRDYENLMALKQARPELDVFYNVSVGGTEYRENTTELTLENADPEEVGAALPYLPELKKVAFTGTAPENARIYEWKCQYPDVTFVWSFDICGVSVTSLDTELTLENADPSEVAAALPYLPELSKVTFTGVAPENERIYEWKCQYPDVTFVWSFDVCGVSTTSLDTELILSDIPMESVEEVENALKYFYDMQWVEMCDCGISSEEMDALWKRHPETRFVWEIYMGNCVLRTDDISFIPYRFGYGKGNRLTDEDCKELKYCVDMVCLDMGHMAITDYSFLEYMPKIQYLVLADTKGTDFTALKKCTELVFLEVFWTDFADASVLSELTKLEDVNLSYTNVVDFAPVLEMKHLKRLWLVGMTLPEEDQQELKEALPDTLMFIHPPHPLVSCTQSGWRQSPNYFKMRDLLGMWYMTD